MNGTIQSGSSGGGLFAQSSVVSEYLITGVVSAVGRSKRCALY